MKVDLVSYSQSIPGTSTETTLSFDGKPSTDNPRTPSLVPRSGVLTIYAFGNNNLSTVVRTQKARCNIMPKINIPKIVRGMFHFIKYANNQAPMIVIITSTQAILNKRNFACTPVFGSPNKFLYLHNPNML